MAVGGAGGTAWIKILVAGLLLVGVAYALPSLGVEGWTASGLLALGGLAVVFGSCEALIIAVEGVGKRAGWNDFVAGTMGGLASNTPSS